MAGRCLRAGAQVGGIDIDRAALAEAASAHGACFTAIPVDIRDELAVHTALAALGSRFTDVHGLVNCAGVGGYTGDVTQTSMADWQRIIGVNLTGTMLGIRTLAPLMPDHDGASIVNIGSIAGLSGHFALSYTVSKWGLRGLTRAVALELAGRGIRVNIVHPGPIDTPILDGADPVFVQASIDTTLAGRAGRADEVADVVVFLLSARAAYLNGQDIPVDGGFSSHGGAKSITDALAKAHPDTW